VGGDGKGEEAGVQRVGEDAEIALDRVRVGGDIVRHRRLARALEIVVDNLDLRCTGA